MFADSTIEAIGVTAFAAVEIVTVLILAFDLVLLYCENKNWTFFGIPIETISMFDRKNRKWAWFTLGAIALTQAVGLIGMYVHLFD